MKTKDRGGTDTENLPPAGSLSSWQQQLVQARLKSRASSWSSAWWQGPKPLGYLLLLFPDLWQEAGLEVEHLGHEPVPLWDICFASGGFIHCAVHGIMFYDFRVCQDTVPLMCDSPRSLEAFPVSMMPMLYSPVPDCLLSQSVLTYICFLSHLLDLPSTNWPRVGQPSMSKSVPNRRLGKQ